MIILSDAASNQMLDSVGRMLNGGSIELLDATGTVMATLKLSNPATMEAASGEVVLNKIAEGDARATGQLKTARVLARDGSEVFLCDVGTADSEAVIKLSTTQINRGSPVRIDTFRLSMP